MSGAKDEIRPPKKRGGRYNGIVKGNGNDRASGEGGGSAAL
jgi:hypothetical protein